MGRQGAPDDPAARRLALLRVASFLALVGVAFAVVVVTGSFPSADELRDRGDELGALADFIYVPAFVLLNFVITWPILAGAGGLLFGTAAGTPLALAGVLGAALTQMAIARYLAGEQAGRLLPRRVRALEGFLQRRGAVAVMETRIVPALPYGAVNYAAGLTRLRFRDMAVGTVIGAAPKVFGYAALGGSLGNLGAPEAKVAIALMVVVAIAGALLVRRELSGPQPGGAPGPAA
jgi:uncharacterized membrane protein YdjX (TVP38/TMEM64 family)